MGFMRADMPEGTVLLQWPQIPLSVASVDAIEELIALQLRVIRRSALAAELAEAARQDAVLAAREGATMIADRDALDGLMDDFYVASNGGRSQSPSDARERIHAHFAKRCAPDGAVCMNCDNERKEPSNVE